MHYTFPIEREPNISLDGLLHFLMRRVEGLTYKDLMYMTIKKRDSFFSSEYEIYLEEVKNAKKS